VSFIGLWHRLRGGRLTKKRASGSVAAGLFIGSLPLFGLHFPLCLLVCVPFRLDVITAYVAANISNPLFAPFLVAWEIQLGSLILDGHFVGFDLERARAMGISGFVEQAAVGSVLTGAILALLGAVMTAFIARRRPDDSHLEEAIDRTIDRYAKAPRGDRFYVAAKLRSDPVVERLAALDGDFGEVLDVAAGRGQLALFLVDAGRASRAAGFDWDERKTRVAAEAAGDQGQFESRDLRGSELPSADTVLLIDVLHYLPRAEQDALLERAAAAVRPGGRVIVRELDPSRGLRSKVGALAERIATRTSYNRGAGLEFRSVPEIMAELEKRGLSCQLDSGSGSPLPNVMIVAERKC
jgi:uncharacterized protein (DUF2062 family)